VAVAVLAAVVLVAEVVVAAVVVIAGLPVVVGLSSVEIVVEALAPAPPAPVTAPLRGPRPPSCAS